MKTGPGRSFKRALILLLMLFTSLCTHAQTKKSDSPLPPRARQIARDLLKGMEADSLLEVQMQRIRDKDSVIMALQKNLNRKQEIIGEMAGQLLESEMIQEEIVQRNGETISALEDGNKKLTRQRNVLGGLAVLEAVIIVIVSLAALLAGS